MPTMPVELASVASPVPRRLLPHSLEAEMSVVGGVLLAGDRAYNQVCEMVSSEDFYHPALAAIFESMAELERSGRPIDQVTVIEHMRAADTLGKLRAFNGEAYLAELMSSVVTVENLAFHARIVRGKATARRLIEAAQEIAGKGYADYGEVDDFIDEAERAIFEIAQRSQKQGYAPVKDVLKAAMAAVEARFRRKQVITGVPSGFSRLDDLTAGFQPSDLIIVAARPSMGKTSLAMNAAQHAALVAKMPVLVFSLEMSKEALVERMLCSEAQVDSSKLRRGFLDTRDWMALTNAAGKVSGAPLWIDDSGAPTLLEIRAKCRRWRANDNIFKGDDQLGLVVIDYLQLIHGRPQGREQNREREISEISRGLKALAKELKLPIIALSQLNRSLESRGDKRPQLSDLRESGAIEQDADLICFIYRDEVYNKDESKDKGVAEVIVGKQRNGPTGTARLLFRNQYTRFENLEENRDDV